MDEKISKAIEIISNEISKLPANTIMDHGTLGHSQGKTKREGQAQQMAVTFVKMLNGIRPTDNHYPETGDAERDAEMAEQIKNITNAAIEKVGR